MNHIIPIVLLLLASTANANPEQYADSIHDGHIHYDQDVWEALPPHQAIELLTEQNIKRALVSATPTQGAEMLYRENPQIVIPMLRPYKDAPTSLSMV